MAELIPIIVSAATAAATAAVAAAPYVLAAGVGLSIVGKITGNETLSKIGGYASMAGGATMLAGMASEFLAPAFEAGGLFGEASATSSVLSSEGAIATTQTVAGELAGEAAIGGAAEANAALGASVQPAASLASGGGASAALAGAGAVDATIQAPSAGGLPDANGLLGSVPQSTGPKQVNFAQGGDLAASTIAASRQKASSVFGTGGEGPGANAGGGSFFSKLEPAEKALFVSGAFQGIGGLAGGVFEGLSASDANGVRRFEQDERFARGSHAPLLSFGTPRAENGQGLVNARPSIPRLRDTGLLNVRRS